MFAAVEIQEDSLKFAAVWWDFLKAAAVDEADLRVVRLQQLIEFKGYLVIPVYPFKHLNMISQ